MNQVMNKMKNPRAACRQAGASEMDGGILL